MVWLDVEVLAGEQYGLITSAQVDVRGVSRATLHRKVRQGYVQQVRRGVYVLSSARWDIHRDLRAAWLSLDPKKSAGERLWDSPQFIVASASAAEVYGEATSIHSSTSFIHGNVSRSLSRIFICRVAKICLLKPLLLKVVPWFLLPD